MDTSDGQILNDVSAYGGTFSNIVMQKVKIIDIVYAKKKIYKSQNRAVLGIKHGRDDDNLR